VTLISQFSDMIVRLVIAITSSQCHLVLRSKLHRRQQQHAKPGRLSGTVDPKARQFWVDHLRQRQRRRERLHRDAIGRRGAQG